MNSLWRWPFLWFVVIGLVLFIVDSQFQQDRIEIRVTPALRERLATLWTTQTGLTASEAELDSLVQNWIREEVLYQEALRLGLDQEDSIVRRRLVQKLGFIAESTPIPEPESSALLSFYRENISDYTLPERYSFRQLYFSTQEAAQEALANSEQQGIEPMGQSTMLNASYAFRSALDLNASLGFGFADQLQELEVGKWQGPVRSGFGYHLLFITSVEPEQISEFESVRLQVARDYREFQRTNVLESFVDGLMDDYSIVIER